MLEWLKSLPKTIFVTLVLTLGVLFIVFSDPPHSICDSQMEQFQALTKDFLFVKDGKSQTPPRIHRLIELCLSTNSAGGCYELFSSLKQLLRDVETVSPECFGKLTDVDEFTNGYWKSVDLLAQLAWGSKAPNSNLEKSGWLDTSDLNLFCNMKKTGIFIYGQERWDSFASQYLTKLPGASQINRTEAWQRTIFSVNCSNYL